ncbi:LPS export ABC transporter periplasmic protein LptC [Hoeflea sp. G2-23]|uniref:LPS export ABC transporter periplasmic protein LptC n=1 Tax=Hoeflea algicola TaxID=2983763 RepID=A0ABT3ZCN1_9HYPH|nr:LPS export ABC transporter periplasmic protein LptC [Hoeflea algicola]MCY0149559.1 LPS export ABC transporter periplasmic protein LptC [Hoeflea algicola]
MATSTVSDIPVAGAYAGRSHAEYRRASIHSRRVRMLKFLLPLASALIVVAFVTVSWVDGMVPEGIAIESVAVRDGKLVMQNPVMSGQTSDGRSYRIEALRAIQDLATPNVVQLEEIVAELPAADGKNARLEAISGIYDRTAQTLRFDQPFTVTDETGFSAEMNSASIDMASNEMSTSDPVSIRSGEASVVAQSMNMQDNGRVIVFEDKVRMTIKPSAVRSGNGATN